jgi:dTDP-4-dehydrorhamnose reductase
MKLLVTGLGGTLAPKVARAATARGLDVCGWDRRRWPADDADAFAAVWRELRPDAVLHLALGPVAWAQALAAQAASRALPFVLTSTAMVFDHAPDGPHAIDDPRTARDDYGRYKIAVEDAVRGAHPGACIARIGWQIDADARGNNMLAHLDAAQAQGGEVGASRVWRPACSFMDDTAGALLDCVLLRHAGKVHLDSNAAEGHPFDAIVRGLGRVFVRDAWRVRVHEDYRHDQRLVGGPVALPPLSARLGLLG